MRVDIFECFVRFYRMTLYPQAAVLMKDMVHCFIDVFGIHHVNGKVPAQTLQKPVLR